MEKQTTNHNKYYYEEGRNGWIPTTTNDNFKKKNKVNPKMKMTKEELGLKKNIIPEYYKGKEGYEARRVCDNFDLSYHLATAITYIIRAYRKHKTPVDCIEKAMAHLQFELDKIKRNV